MADGPKIAVVGTFDVENFGDLLFPLLTEQELTERLDGAEIRLYSYREKSAESWPYRVRSLVHLHEDIAELDLLIVGAGHLVRFDKQVAPGYDAPPGLHHPTGYWLMPSLLAAANGVPVAWSSLTVSDGTPDWAEAVVALALRAIRYLTVRDEPSRRELVRIVPDLKPVLVPDIAFGIERLLPTVPTEAFLRFLDVNSLRMPYVIVQPSPLLALHADQIDGALRQARADGCTILELPISPALGDSAGLLDLEEPTVRPALWPSPLLLAEIIANAEAVIARSLHLSVVALACGVPVHRHRSAPDPKYEALVGLPGVTFWDDGEEVARAMSDSLGRRSSATTALRSAELDAHWNALAALPGRGSAGPAIVAELINVAVTALESLAATAPMPPAPKRLTIGARLRGSLP